MASVCCVCQHTNPADAKYCNECGDSLRHRRCARCNAINDVAARICDRCGVDIDEARAPTLEAAPSASTASGLPDAAQTHGRFNIDEPNAKRADRLDPPGLAEHSLPSDVASAANVDFLIFPAVQARGPEGASAGDPNVLVPASDASDAANVDFLIFPSSETGNAEIGSEQTDSSLPSAKPRDSRWHERGGGAPLQTALFSSFVDPPAHRDESKATKEETPVEPAPSPWLRRPMSVGLALMLVIGAAAYFAIQLDNPFKDSSDRLHESAVGSSPIRTLYEGSPRASDAGNVKSDAGEPGARVNEGSSTDAIANEPAARGPSEVVQGTVSADERAQKRMTTTEQVSDAPPPARSRATTKEQVSDAPAPARSRTTAAARARPVPAREPAPGPLQQPSTTASCADSIAALGLCGATTGR